MGEGIGTPWSEQATKAVLLGAGELGKEVAIALTRLGVEVTAIDRYAGAPAAQVAHNAAVLDMTDPVALRAAILASGATIVIPEIEAIATQALGELEAAGNVRVVPTARATQLTMDRERIRRLAAEELGLPTSPYRFASSLPELRQALTAVGLPAVVKPVMSSSGKGQTVVRSCGEAEAAWQHASSAGRVETGRVIVEGFVDFDYEVTLLTVRHRAPDGQIATSVCPPIGHRQQGGDYVESWQPQAMTDVVAARARAVAETITQGLGGLGLFGVELFIRGDEVIFSEVSPRPHDTGLVTLASQNLSEFELHARAVLGLPLAITLEAPAASAVIKATGAGVPRFSGLASALADPLVDLRLFGKPVATPGRRLGVVVARGTDVDDARARAARAASCVTVHYD